MRLWFRQEWDWMYWRIYFLAELSLKSEIRNPKLSPLSAASISISGHFAGKTRSICMCISVYLVWIVLLVWIYFNLFNPVSLPSSFPPFVDDSEIQISDSMNAYFYLKFRSFLFVYTILIMGSATTASEFMLLVDNCEFCVCLFKALCLLSLLTMWLGYVSSLLFSHCV